MRIRINKSSIDSMIELCRKHKQNKLSQIELEKMLEHPDYQVEFERYMADKLPTANISKDEFVRYFMNILSLTEDDIKNPRLKSKHKDWISFFRDIDSYKNRYNDFFVITDKEINTIETLLKNSFPAQYLDEIGDIDCLFTLSIGDSMGYPHNNYIHFDYLRLKLLDSKEMFINFIAHEIHHVLYSKILGNNVNKKMSPLEYFTIIFSYEGLAVKFCNNGAGSLTNPLYSTTPNIGMNKDAWAYYEKEFDYMYKEFINDFIYIRDNLASYEYVDGLFRDKWVTPEIKSFINSEPVYVVQYRSYYLGMQLYGRIYDKVGLDEMFKLLFSPEDIIRYFENEII